MLKWSSYCWPPETIGLAKRWFSHLRPAPATCGSTPSNTRRPCGIGVEAAIDEVAQAAAGLRAAPGIRLLDAAQRVGVGAVVFQEADEVAHRDVAEAMHQRILRRIHKLIDPAGLEAGRQVDVPHRTAPQRAPPSASRRRLPASTLAKAPLVVRDRPAVCRRDSAAASAPHRACRATRWHSCAPRSGR